MFKYTPPWQVLCNSMEHEPKKQADLASDNQQHILPLAQEDDLVLIHSDQPITQVPSSTLENSLHTAPMESTPKKWVMQPLSPKLEMKDLRTLLSPSTKQTDLKTLKASNFGYESITIVRPQPSVTVTSKVGDSPGDVVVQARQVAVSDESSSSEEWHHSSPSCPSSPCSSGSQSGFYSFADRSLSPEAEKTEAWMSSPEREAKLAVLKEENGYKLRAYVEEKRPEKLFEEANGDSRYRVEDTEEQEQTQERVEIIRNQAPKINPIFKEQWSTLDRLDLSYSPQRLLEGLSLSYSPAKMEVQQTGAEPGTIDTEQISFSAARQQFVMMEQSKRNPFLQSPLQILQFHEHQERPSQSEVIITSSKGDKDSFPEEQLSQSLISDPDNNPVFTSKMVTMSITEETGTKIQSSCFDDFDSGLGDLPLDPSGGYAYDGNASNDILRVETGGVPSSTSKGETPIEREIRIAQEREESLRRERGIKRTDVKEMVEIKTKPLLSQANPTLTPVKAREKNRVSFLIQRDIEQDSRREADLQHQGKAPGLYDRGTAQELGERKRVFELQEDQIPVMPTKKSLTDNFVDVKQVRPGVEEGRKSPEPIVSGERTMSPETDILSPCCPHRHPDEAALWITSPEYSIQSPASQKRGHSNIKVLPHSILADKASVKDDVRYIASQSTSFNYSPFFMENKVSALLRGPSSSMDTPSPSSDTRSTSPLLGPAVVGKPTLHWPGSPEQFNLRPRRVHTPDAIRKEIECDLKREEELRKLRESGGLSPSMDGGLDSMDKTASTTVDPAPLQRGEEGVTSSLLGLKEEVMGQDKPFFTTLPEEQPKGGSSQSSLWSTDTVDYKESHVTTPIFTPDKTRIIGSASPFFSPSAHLALRFPSMSIMTAQPWVGHRQESPALHRVLPLTPQSAGVEAGGVATQKGLTETLLEDFEERRNKLKLEESSYAGIQPSDEVNNEVLEATRVTRHKNTKALRWEAGVYANEDSN